MHVTRLGGRRSSMPHVRQTFTIRRHPYDSVRAVVSLCHPLISSLPSVNADATGAANASVKSLRSFLAAAAGGPFTPHHEGPLDLCAVTSLRDHLTDDVVERVLREALFDGQLIARPHAWMMDMWDASLQERYVTALLGARREMLDTRRTVKKNAAFTLPRHEAGLALHKVFSETPPEGDVSSTQPWRSSAQADSVHPSLRTLPQQRRRHRWHALIDAHTRILPDRSRIHELENGPQEITMAEIIHAEVQRLARSPHSAGWQPNLVVDVGGGNGFLTAQVAERLACDGLIIDPHIPQHAIDCLPSYWPCVKDRQRPVQPRHQVLHRRQSFFHEVHLSTGAAPGLPSFSPAHTVLIAKHLCGSAIDECLRQLHAEKSLPRVLVLAPCCFNKIQLNTYCDPVFLSRALSITDQDTLARITRLTDWNMSCGQSAADVSQSPKSCTSAPVDGGLPLHLHTGRATHSTAVDAELVSMQRASRHGGMRSVAHHVPCMHAASQMVEGIVNYGRAQWLRAHSYTRVVVTQYVPDCVTPKNKCIIAVRDA